MLNFSSILEEPYSISEEQHKIDLEHLNKNVNNEFFYFVMDIPTAEISNIHGTHLWLGYPDNTFNLKHYIQIMHPSQYLMYVTIMRSMLQALLKKDYEIKYLTHRFVSNTVLRNHEGKYLLFKRVISPWQFDKNRKPVANLNEFYLLGEYKGESFNPRASNRYNTKDVEKTMADEVINMLKNSAEKFLPFNTFQFRIIRLLAYQPEISEKEMADILKISKNTVHYHSKNILLIAKDHFHIPFKSTKEVASYLKSDGFF
ncbi:MAG: winged helix-turn-helix domain-containing protein [Chitinophagales bacterium]